MLWRGKSSYQTPLGTSTTAAHTMSPIFRRLQSLRVRAQPTAPRAAAGDKLSRGVLSLTFASYTLCSHRTEALQTTAPWRDRLRQSCRLRQGARRCPYRRCPHDRPTRQRSTIYSQGNRGSEKALILYGVCPGSFGKSEHPPSRAKVAAAKACVRAAVAHVWGLSDGICWCWQGQAWFV